MRTEKFQGGFILISALMALCILIALGTLVFIVTTQDIRISSRGLGEKKAFAAAETGAHVLIRDFDPANKDASKVTDVPVDAANDAESRYSISPPAGGWIPTQPPYAIPIPGFSMGGGEAWGRTRTLAISSGTNSRYQSNVQIEVGVGYGPVKLTTDYP
jgi:hypothetical protein